MLEFYTAPTPNGWKVAMTLEEMELDYQLRMVNLSAGEQHEESYLAITQNFDALRPYHWWRPWPPWYGGSEQKSCDGDRCDGERWQNRYERDAPFGSL